MNNSKWRVATIPVGDTTVYQVYRKRNRPGEPDHTGNREFWSGVFRTKEDAQQIADDLNAID